MKRTLLDFLICPRCPGEEPFLLEEESTEGDEITHGTLRCSKCGATYPVVDAIPRFVTTDAYADNFGFEWNTFRKVQIDVLNQTQESQESFAERTGLDPVNLQGKTVLDVGSGAGRYAEVASRWGAKDVIALDLTSAVTACHKNIGQRPNVHIIQANLFEIPLRPRSFDIVYSIGVLHHTPNTRDAFGAASKMVKPRGLFAVYLYSLYYMGHKFSDVYRRITTRLPNRVLYWLSALAVPMYYIYRIPVLGILLDLVCPTSLHPNWRWRWLDTFDWYSPKYQWKHSYPEVFHWFIEEGFTDIQLPKTDIAVCMTARLAPQRAASHRPGQE